VPGATSVTRLQPGTLRTVSGSFDLRWLGATALLYTAVTVPSDATAAQLAAAISSSGDLGSVNVTRSSSGYGGYTWSVTFTEYAGAVPLLQIDAAALCANGALTKAHASVQTGSGTCCVSGSFMPAIAALPLLAAPISISAAGVVTPANAAELPAAALSTRVYGAVLQRSAGDVRTAGEQRCTVDDYLH
jgi:hypothetical protein